MAIGINRGDKVNKTDDRPLSVGGSWAEEVDSLSHLDRVAPKHGRTSCSDEAPTNGSFSAEDGGGCRRCDLLLAMQEGARKFQKEQDAENSGLLVYYSSLNTKELVLAMEAHVKRLLRKLNKLDPSIKTNARRVQK